eukprot:PhF_6_TR33652/c0_g1_i2/m.49224
MDELKSVKEIVRQLEPSVDWEKRKNALRSLQNLAAAGAAQNFKDTQLRDALSKQIVDLRSSVANEAASTVRVLAKRLPADQWRGMSDWFLPSLFHNVCLSHTVSDVARAVLFEMFERKESCTSAAYSELLTQSKSKHAAIRAVAFDCLKVSIQCHLPEKLKDKVHQTIHDGLQDALAEVRACSRSIVEFLESQVVPPALPTTAPVTQERTRRGPRERTEGEGDASHQGLTVTAPASFVPPLLQIPSQQGLGSSTAAPQRKDTKTQKPSTAPPPPRSHSANGTRVVPETPQPIEHPPTTQQPPSTARTAATTQKSVSFYAPEDIGKKLRSVVWSEKVAGLQAILNNPTGISAKDCSAVIKCLSDSNPRVIGTAFIVCRRSISVFVDENIQNGIAMFTAALNQSSTSSDKDAKENSEEFLQTMCGLPLSYLAPLWGKTLTAVAYTKLRVPCVNHIIATLTREMIEPPVINSTILHRTVLEPLGPILRQTQTQKEAIQACKALEALFPGVLDEYIKTLPAANQREWVRVLQIHHVLARQPTKSELQPLHIDPYSLSPPVSPRFGPGGADLVRVSSERGGSLSPRRVPHQPITRDRMLAFVRGASTNRNTEKDAISFTLQIAAYLLDITGATSVDIAFQCLRIIFTNSTLPSDVILSTLKALKG